MPNINASIVRSVCSSLAIISFLAISCLLASEMILNLSLMSECMELNLLSNPMNLVSTVFWMMLFISSILPYSLANCCESLRGSRPGTSVLFTTSAWWCLKSSSTLCCVFCRLSRKVFK